MNIEEVRKAAEWYRSCTTPLDGLMMGDLMRIDELAEWAAEELARRDAEAAERALPITEEWLKSINTPSWHSYGVFEFLLDKSDARCTAMVTPVRDAFAVQLLSLIKTRGQLLDLLAALQGNQKE